MEGLYKLHIDCGRQGKLPGLFIAEVEDVELLINSGVHVYFGEVLGKHSEIYGSLREKDCSLITTDVNYINLVKELDLENGYNPFDYVDEDWKDLIKEE